MEGLNTGITVISPGVPIEPTKPNLAHIPGCSELPYAEEYLPPWSTDSFGALFEPFNEAIVMERC